MREQEIYDEPFGFGCLLFALALIAVLIVAAVAVALFTERSF